MPTEQFWMPWFSLNIFFHATFTQYNIFWARDRIVILLNVFSFYEKVFRNKIIEKIYLYSIPQ